MEWLGTVCTIVGAGTISYAIIALIDMIEGGKKK